MYQLMHGGSSERLFQVQRVPLIGHLETATHSLHHQQLLPRLLTQGKTHMCKLHLQKREWKRGKSAGDWKCACVAQNSYVCIGEAGW